MKSADLKQPVNISGRARDETVLGCSCCAAPVMLRAFRSWIVTCTDRPTVARNDGVKACRRERRPSSRSPSSAVPTRLDHTPAGLRANSCDVSLPFADIGAPARRISICLPITRYAESVLLGSPEDAWLPGSLGDAAHRSAPKSSCMSACRRRFDRRFRAPGRPDLHGSSDKRYTTAARAAFAEPGALERTVHHPHR